MLNRIRTWSRNRSIVRMRMRKSACTQGDSRRVLDIEHGTFTPLIFTTTGHSRLAELIAIKKGEQYAETVSWIRSRNSFALLNSALVCLKRPSHDKRKFANSCWKTSKSWQTRAFTCQTHVKSQHAKFATWPTYCSGTHEELPLVSWSCCTLIAKEETESRWNVIKVWTKPYISRNLTRVAHNTLVQELLLLTFLCRYTLQTKCPTDLKNSELRRWMVKSYTFVFTSVRHFVKCYANQVNRAGVLIGWQSPTHVRQPFTRQIRACQLEKVGEKVNENRDKFYLSPTVCQLVCRLFLRRSHAPTWVCQHEFANFSLPCEGRFRGSGTLRRILRDIKNADIDIETEEGAIWEIPILSIFLFIFSWVFN